MDSLPKYYIYRWLIIGAYVVVLFGLGVGFVTRHLSPREFASAVFAAAAAMSITFTVIFRKARPHIAAAANPPLAPSARKVLQCAVLIMKIWIGLELVILIVVPFMNRDDSLMTNVVLEAVGIAFTAFLVMLLRRGTRRLQEDQRRD